MSLPPVSTPVVVSHVITLIAWLFHKKINIFKFIVIFLMTEKDFWPNGVLIFHFLIPTLTFMPAQCVRVCSSISKFLQQKCKMCNIALLQGEKVRTLREKITLNSPHLALCGTGRLPAALVYAHTLTHTRQNTHMWPGQSLDASVATWRGRIMTSIMSSYSEGRRKCERRGSTFLPGL